MKIKKTRNGETWTEARYWQQVRSFLRKAFRFWKPMENVREKAKRPYTGLNKRQKWEYLCNSCGGWYPQASVQVDHIIPVGSLKNEDDLIGFLSRLTEEDESLYQVLCKGCHIKKTKKEKGGGNVNE